MDRDLVRGIRAHGFDAIPASDVGMIHRSDSDQLAAATTRECVLYSFNVSHFQALHHEWTASGRVRAGIVLVQQRRFSIGEQIRRLARLAESVTADEMRNRLEFLSNW